MNAIDLISLGTNFIEDMSHPTLLFEEEGHWIFWLGTPEPTAFRGNTYLIVDNNEAVIIDPGNADHFEVVFDRVKQVIPPERIMAQVISNADPAAMASFSRWTSINPGMQVITTTGITSTSNANADFLHNSSCIREHPEYRFSSGKSLQFFPAPFLHAPGAFVAYDQGSAFLFSGDIWAAVDMEWRLVVEDFDRHWPKLNLFHLDNMASHVAAHGFIRRIHHLRLGAILPHHGSIIPEPLIPAALDYLKRLKCGTDIYYPDMK